MKENRRADSTLRALFRFTPLLVLTCLATTALAETPSKYKLADLKALEQSFVDLAAGVRPRTVAIRTYLFRDRAEFDVRRGLIPESQGSGFVLSQDGLIGTNYHVIENGEVIDVILSNGDRRRADLVQVDLRSDLAVIRIDADDLTPVTFGNAGDIRINQWAFACGNPFGLANDDGNTSVTYGVIAAKGREMTRRLRANDELQYYGNMLQTSAAINPGNSGGPLFDIDGKMIGVVTAIETRSGVSEGAGYAIPINSDTRRILEMLQEGKRVRYGYMGVQIRDVGSFLSRRQRSDDIQHGAEIEGLSPPNGPADRAGLERGDVIVAVDGESVRDTDHLLRLVQFKPVDSQIEVTFMRDQQEHKAMVRLGDREQLIEMGPVE